MGVAFTALAISITYYFFLEQTFEGLLFLGSCLSLTVSVLLETCIERLSFKNRIVLSFSVLFMLLSILMMIYFMYLGFTDLVWTMPLVFVLISSFLMFWSFYSFTYRLLKEYS